MQAQYVLVWLHVEWATWAYNYLATKATYTKRLLAPIVGARGESSSELTRWL